MQRRKKPPQRGKSPHAGVWALMDPGLGIAPGPPDGELPPSAGAAVPQLRDFNWAAFGISGHAKPHCTVIYHGQAGIASGFPSRDFSATRPSFYRGAPESKKAPPGEAP